MPIRIEEVAIETTEPAPAAQQTAAPAATPLDLPRLAAALRREDERRARLWAD